MRGATVGLFTDEVIDYIIRHNKDEYGITLTHETLSEIPWYEIVGLWWDGLSYYKDSNWYRSLDEITDPTEGMFVAIRSHRKVHKYKYYSGEWVLVGDMDESFYK